MTAGTRSLLRVGTLRRTTTRRWRTNFTGCRPRPQRPAARSESWPRTLLAARCSWHAPTRYVEIIEGYIVWPISARLTNLRRRAPLISQAFTRLLLNETLPFLMTTQQRAMYASRSRCTYDLGEVYL